MTTTVLYLMKDNDGESAEDLRLSLRSLDHAFPEDDIRVALATAAPPGWFTGVHVEAHDLPGLGKHWSMTEKVRTAIRTLRLDMPFLLSSDDHIAPLEPPCRIAEWPYLARKTPLDRFLSPSQRGDVRWRESVAWARNAIARRYLRPTTQLVLCTHRNTWVDPACLPVVDELFPVPGEPPSDRAAWRGPSPDDTFGAVAVVGGLVPESRYLKCRDVKTPNPLRFFGSYLADNAPGRYGCSIPPGADAVRGPLWRIFRRPSRWERA